MHAATGSVFVFQILGYVCVHSSLLDLWFYVYLPPSMLRVLSPFPISGCIFLIASMVRSELLFSPCVCGLLLSYFGHFRAKNNSEIALLSLSCVHHFWLPSCFPFSFTELWIAWFCCVYVVVGIWNVWEWEWRLGMLDKLGVFGSLIDRTRGLDFFSTTPE